MTTDPYIGGWDFPGPARADEVADAAIAEFLSHPPTRCCECEATAEAAVMVNGTGAAKYATALFPMCTEHAAVNRSTRTVFARAVDGHWVT